MMQYHKSAALCTNPMPPTGSGPLHTNPSGPALLHVPTISLRSLQRTLAELRDYQRKHEYWQAQHDRLSQEQAPPDERRLQRAALDSHRERESQVNMGEYRRSARSAVKTLSEREAGTERVL